MEPFFLAESLECPALILSFPSAMCTVLLVVVFSSQTGQEEEVPQGPTCCFSKQAPRTPSMSTFLITLWNRQEQMREIRGGEVPEISDALQGSFKTASLLFDSRLPCPTRPSDALVLTVT